MASGPSTDILQHPAQAHPHYPRRVSTRIDVIFKAVDLKVGQIYYLSNGNVAHAANVGLYVVGFGNLTWRGNAELI